jgi:hypothetical protein
MSAACPGWTVIRSPEELEEHDPADPAYFLIPASLVRAVGEWLFALEQPGVVGNLSRYIQGLMTGQARALAPVTTRSPTGIDDTPIPVGDGEEPEDEIYDVLTRTGIVDTE